MPNILLTAVGGQRSPHRELRVTDDAKQRKEQNGSTLNSEKQTSALKANSASPEKVKSAVTRTSLSGPVCANQNKESQQNQNFPTQEATGLAQQGPAEECGSENRNHLQIQFHSPFFGVQCPGSIFEIHPPFLLHSFK